MGFSNFSFASVLDDSYKNIEERAYYLENCYEGLYLNVDPYTPKQAHKAAKAV